MSLLLMLRSLGGGGGSSAVTGTAVGAWGSWTGTAVGTVDVTGTGAATWGGWTGTAIGQTPVEDPPVTSGLTLHLEADTLPQSNGAPVTAWLDAASGLHALALSAAPSMLTSAFPTGANGVAFDGTNDALTVTTPTSIATDLFPVSAYTVFSVFTPRTFTTSSSSAWLNDAVWSDEEGYVGLALHSTGPKAIAHHFSTVAEAAEIAITEDVSIVVHQRLGSGTLSVAVNGGTEVTDSAANVDSFGLSLTQISLGKNYNTVYTDVVIGALLIYNRALTSLEVADVNAYLYDKYINTGAAVTGTASATWGGWTGTAAGTVDVTGTGSGTWGGWTGTASGTVNTTVTGTAVGTWGGWTGTAQGAASLFLLVAPASDTRIQLSVVERRRQGVTERWASQRGRVRVPVGALLKISGVYQVIVTPTADQLAEAEEFYLGGHEYEVTLATAQAVIAAGFSDWIT